jgi:hypothetical protein
VRLPPTWQGIWGKRGWRASRCLYRQKTTRTRGVSCMLVISVGCWLVPMIFARHVPIRASRLEGCAAAAPHTTAMWMPRTALPCCATLLIAWTERRLTPTTWPTCFPREDLTTVAVVLNLVLDSLSHSVNLRCPNLLKNSSTWRLDLGWTQVRYLPFHFISLTFILVTVYRRQPGYPSVTTTSIFSGPVQLL